MECKKDRFRKLEELQRHLADQVRLSPLNGPVRSVAGVDCSERHGRIRAAAVLMSWPQMEELDRSVFEGKCRFPYVPGFLSFRELGPMIRALTDLKGRCDLVMVDGCGIAHPRGLGIASHLGWVMGRPSIGISKSVLVGVFEEPGEGALSASPLMYMGEQVGWAVRSRQRCRPIFVSPGHLVDMEGALRLAKESLRGYKLPEPIRRADRLSKQWKG